ncbi:MAG TPA: D-glycero-beta-D-manno-heptose 1-phosphate adenylyltransferase [Chloroflexia bacterium]|nr:D-glycero-beta-D-manno-heptose 1-phosphate adenylyltransferase [Chloroflexia bacterium]
MMADRVVALSELHRMRSRWRTEGKRLVLTNGTFDVLHIGHVRYLEAARALGDVLVVGVNSDASVRAYKGPGRPVVPQDERAELVAALRCVDYTTIFDEPTATHLVAALEPEIYVKGGDYAAATGKPLPEAEAVRAHGGEVHIIPYLEGHSASELIEKMSRRTSRRS